MTDEKKLTDAELAAVLEQVEESLKKSEKPVDITKRVSPMKMHDHMSMPSIDSTFKLTGDEVEFTLSLLSRVHQTLVEDVRNQDLPSDDRNTAYSMALKVEKLYGSMFSQLKLNKPDRPELH